MSIQRSTLTVCASVLSYDDVVMRAREAVFHLRCFTCIICSAPLHPGELFAMGEHGALYCQGGIINRIQTN
uniref:LIM zinc-binding domain-containing protein n=1 Tax=Parascaris equorum TaxID=6256 RepID=A0A914S4F1_PAREQ